MKFVKNYKFFVSLTLFAIAVTCFVNIFFYISIHNIIPDSNVQKLNETTLLFCFIMIMLTVVFIFFVTFIVKIHILPSIDENIRLKHKFESMSESIGDGVLALNTQGEIVFVNRAALNLLGYKKEEMLGYNAHELIHYETRDGVFVKKEECYVLKSLKENGICASEDDIYIRKDRIKIDISFVATPLIINGKNEGSILVFSDITERKANNKKLILADTIVENIREGVLVTDKDGVIVFANSYFESITGYAPSAVVGKKPNILKSGIHNEQFYRDMWIRITMNGCWQGEIWNRRKDGKLYAEWLNITVVNGKKNSGEKYYVAIFTDITERKLLEDELSKERELLKYQATYDTLTKLYNRQKIEEVLEAEFDRSIRYGTVFSIIMLDIDNFKAINDNFGHLTGDLILKEISDILKSNVRKSDFVCRWGGEEFLIVAAQTDIAGAQALAENIREIIDNTIFTAIGRVTCSFGASSIDNKGGDDRDSLVKRADDALYMSKQEGKNKVTLL